VLAYAESLAVAAAVDETPPAPQKKLKKWGHQWVLLRNPVLYNIKFPHMDPKCIHGILNRFMCCIVKLTITNRI
jgi:hypothetical protein